MKIYNQLFKNRPIDIYNPVNRSHYLNRARMSWWLTLPGLAGGSTFFDLMNSNPGTLTSFTTGFGWVPTTRIGGLGEISMVSNSYVAINNSYANTFNGQDFTFAGWCKVFNPATVGLLIGGAGSIPAIYCDSNSQFMFYGGGDALHAPTNIVIGNWYHIVGTYFNSSTTKKVYLNGVLANTSSAAITYGGITLHLGGDNFNQFLRGSLDDCSVYNRALSASEVFDLYQESLAGYPNTINRVNMDVSKSFGGIVIPSLLFRRSQFNRTGSRGENQ